ncbi:MAG: hypothetical protein ACQEXV_24095 [Bacillota bacterium]
MSDRHTVIRECDDNHRHEWEFSVPRRRDRRSSAMGATIYYNTNK